MKTCPLRFLVVYSRHLAVVRFIHSVNNEWCCYLYRFVTRPAYCRLKLGIPFNTTNSSAMIYHALKFLAGQLGSYFDGLKEPGGFDTVPEVLLQNVSRLSEDDLKTANQVLLTLVNLSEEATMKNNPGTYVVNSNEAHYDNPPVNLNLYLLFTVCMVNYEHALSYLSHTISFFQGKYSFTRKNSVTAVDGLPDDFHIILDLYSLTFEQANYLWSTLGGKQHPFVCYKVRLLSISRESTRETRGVIKQIRIDDQISS